MEDSLLTAEGSGNQSSWLVEIQMTADEKLWLFSASSKNSFNFQTSFKHKAATDQSYGSP